jgi:carboxyl-terminal processing protease
LRSDITVAQEPGSKSDLLVKSAQIVSEKYLVPIPKDFLLQSALLRMKAALVNPDLLAQPGFGFAGQGPIFGEQRFEGGRGEARPAPDPAKVQQLIKTIDEVYSLVKQKPDAKDSDYLAWLEGIFALNQTLEVASGDGLARAALGGMLAEVSGRPERGESRATQWRRYGERYGSTGLHFHLEEGGRARVHYVQPGSPASRADSRQGDLILKINGKETKGQKEDEISQSLRGKPGTKMVVTVQHEGADRPQDIELVCASRGSWSQSVRGKFVSPDSKIGYVRCWSLQEGAGGDVDDLVQDLAQQGMAGLIVDLRVGWMESFATAAELVDRLVGGEWTLVYESREGLKKETRSAKPGAAYPDVPVVVLVERNTQGPEELIAAAVKATGRGLVIGDTTAGRAVGQQEFAVPGHDYRLKFAAAVYRTPKGDEFQGKGIEPDIRVEMEPASRGRLMMRMQNEDFGQRGYQVMYTGRRQGREEEEVRDVQLEKAIEYLGGTVGEFGKKPEGREREGRKK